LEQIAQKVINYEQETYAEYYRRSSRSVQKANVRRKVPIKEDLIGELVLCCTKGGKNFKPTGDGTRPNQK
jgi:hypothetical protein